MIPYHAAVLIAITTAYLMGSISTAIIVCWIMRLPDPRSTGSHNPGTTNVLRIGGKQAAFLTLCGDMLKGFLPILVAKWYSFTPFILSMVALSTFLGHLFPLFFRFRGGKGVATLLGCLLALNIPLGLAAVLTWIITIALFRYSSLSSLITAIVAPFYTWYFADKSYVVVVTLMSLLLIYRHQQNIRNLLAGKENRVGETQQSSHLI